MATGVGISVAAGAISARWHSEMPCAPGVPHRTSPVGKVVEAVL
jgi:hypothetical protein